MKFLKLVKRFSARLSSAQLILLNKRGSGEQVAWLIGILIVVVVGLILLTQYGDNMKEIVGSVFDRAKEMFNYE